MSGINPVILAVLNLDIATSSAFVTVCLVAAFSTSLLALAVTGFTFHGLLGKHCVQILKFRKHFQDAHGPNLIWISENQTLGKQRARPNCQRYFHA
jgi:hypothetical protein